MQPFTGVREVQYTDILTNEPSTTYVVWVDGEIERFCDQNSEAEEIIKRTRRRHKSKMSTSLGTRSTK